MPSKRKNTEPILRALNERAKELNCLYEVNEALKDADRSVSQAGQRLVDSLPPGWQFPEVCCARLRIDDEVFLSDRFRESPWRMQAPIQARDEQVGEIEVFYTEPRPKADEGPFLKEERRLIQTIADRIGLTVMQNRVREMHDTWESAMKSIEDKGQPEWGVILEFLRRTDPELLIRLTRKMINHLHWTAVVGAEELLSDFLSKGENASDLRDENSPVAKQALADMHQLTERTFETASRHLGENEVVTRIQEWIEEEKSGFLVHALENPHSSLADIAEAMERFRSAETRVLPEALRKSLRVSLLRRLFVDDLHFINMAKDHVTVRDFYNLLDHMIYAPGSHGHLGGKSAGLFVAEKILRQSERIGEFAENLKVPNTWYISSDSLHEFIRYNNLEDLYNRKYMAIEQVRQDYPHIVQVFKNSQFPPEIAKGLALALDDFEEKPLIVRSSSLLEDQLGSAFSGKYKSLFIANQGTKRERLNALQDAIAEVYASIFSPDPIQYREQRGLLDFHEEMGIMIQEVVGKRVGHYFLPAYAGVAFGNNEFRWSPRIKREDGVVRLVPGLGTRAVDRLADDYPVLVSPGQPDLRVNTTTDETVRYSPNKIDVINLKSNRFETRPVQEFIDEVGLDFPGLKLITSIVEQDRVRPPAGLEPDLETQEVVVTFENLIGKGEFIKNMREMLQVLRESLGAPPDIEFASDGERFYLLQCRTQSYTVEFAPAPIPQDVPKDRLVFSANRYVSNGRVPDITHIVYVDPEAYANLGLEDLKAVGNAVSRLNALLPKRQFILMGPGRWGSRGDIRLGVQVNYSDINRTAVLLEIARKKGNYVPELSFGTHFFQDLVETDIRYIPLYPDEEGNVFNERFLKGAYNILPDILPNLVFLSKTIHVIDVPREREGKILSILMNADIDQAVGIITTPGGETDHLEGSTAEPETADDQHWQWRLRMAERIAADLDAEEFGVKGIYIFGSAKNGTAGPGSDIDLLVHVSGEEETSRRELSLWFDGWSRSLAEMNYLRTGYQSQGLLDIHFITDEDIENKTSYAVKIGAVTDAARPLRMGKESKG